MKKQILSYHVDDAMNSKAKENATAIEALPELAEKLRESINLLIGAAAWLKSSGQPMVAQGLRKWVAEHGQPTLDRAEGVQDAETD